MEKQTTLEPLYELLRRDTSLEAGSSLQRAILKKFFRASRVNIKKADSGYKVKICQCFQLRRQLRSFLIFLNRRCILFYRVALKMIQEVVTFIRG